jgi:hypothetical protein
MHGINTDLLRAMSRHHADGRPKDPYAHHRAEHLAQRREARRQHWQGWGHWLVRLLHRRSQAARPAKDCP